MTGFDVTVDYNEQRKTNDQITEPSTISFSGETETLLLDLNIASPVDVHANNIVFSIPYNDQYLLAQINAGEGHLTLVSDFGIFSNWRIGEKDHALLLSRLVESTSSTTIWVNDNFNGFKGLFSLIWENYKWVVLLLACLLLL